MSRAIFHMIGFKFSTSFLPGNFATLWIGCVCLNVFKVLSEERHIIISWLLDFSLSRIGFFLYILYDVVSMVKGKKIIGVCIKTASMLLNLENVEERKKKGALYFIIIHFILIDDSLPRTFNSNIVLNLMRVCVFLTKSDGLLEH